MKRLTAILVFFLFAQPAFTQGHSYWNRCGDIFDQNKYDPDTFRVKRTEYGFGKNKIVVTVLHHQYLSEDQVWVEQRFNDYVFQGKYLGGIGHESGVALPAKQPFPDYFMLYDASEFAGTYYLLTENGFWFELPGGELVMNDAKTVLYTYTPGECGKCRIGKFDLKTQELTTKWSEGSEDAWPEVKYETVKFRPMKEKVWVKWGK